MAGIRIREASAETTLLLTPDILSVVSFGRVDMPAAIVANKYGLIISLPGTPLYKEESLSLLATPFELNIDVLAYYYDYVDGEYAVSWFMHDTFTFYTRNESTGVMTEWTPDVSDPTDYDSIISIYPVAFWDKLGATTFSEMRIFAAMCYEVYDTSASTFIKVYTIGSEGVEQVDYAVYARDYTEI